MINMKNPDISFYGQVIGEFKIYLKSINVLKQIRNGVIKPHRTMCYPCMHLGDEFMDALSLKLNINNMNMDMEIYVPDADYPAHIDKGGISFMVPLEHGCTAIIAGIKHDLIPWGIYSFDDGQPHATTGGMLMLKKR